MEHDRAPGLRCHSDRDADQVCRKGGPHICFDLGYCAIHIREDPQFLTCRDDQVIIFHLPSNAQALKDMRVHVEIRHACIVDANCSMCESRGAHEADHFEITRPSRKSPALNPWPPRNVTCVRADLFDLSAESIQEVT